MIKLPDVIREELIRKLKQNKEVNIENVGRFYLTPYRKDASLIPKGSGEMRVMKNKNFMRIGFKAVPSFKKEVK